MSEDKRKFARLPLERQVKIRFRGKEHFIKHFLKDVSLGGMFLKSGMALPIDTEFHFEFTIDEELPKISGKGLVVRLTTDNKGEPKGMGIKFLSLDAKSKELLESIIDEFRSKAEK